MPKGQKVVGSKWVFKLIRYEDGSVERCKARLVAQGYSQEKGLNYDEIFNSMIPCGAKREEEGTKLLELNIFSFIQ